MELIRKIIGSLLIAATFGGIFPSSQSDAVLKNASIKKSSRYHREILAREKEDVRFANELEKMGIRLHPGTKHRKDSKPTPRTETKCKSLVYRTLQALPKPHTEFMKDLTLFFTPDGRRGLAGGNQIILRCLNVEDFELSGVLTHEIGHLVDEKFLTGNKESGKSGFHDFGAPLYEDDQSVRFYRLSWVSHEKRRDESSPFDFVSGYAMSDPFEDFAETYLMYRFHGPEFRAIAEGNLVLQQKYNFMKVYIFDGEEFEKNAASNFPAFRRVYDATTLPFEIPTSPSLRPEVGI